jgi:flagellar hook-length control protein FliK
MTAPVASPSMNPPDPGAAAAKTSAAAPDSDTGFGAMLSQLEGAPDVSPPATANAPVTAGDESAAADAAAAVLSAAANLAPWMAQLDATKISAPKQDTPAEPDALPGPDLPEPRTAAAANQAPISPSLPPTPQTPVPQPSVPVAFAPQPSVPAVAPQTSLPDPAADGPAGATTFVTAQAAPDAPVVQDNAPEPAPVEQPATANHPKEQKPANVAGTEADQPAQQAVIGLADLSSPVAAQFLAAPATPQPTSAPDVPINPAPRPEDSLAAAQPVPAQATPPAPAPAPAGKNINPKNAAASDAKPAAETRSSAPRDSRPAAPSDSTPAAANANDTPDSIVGNAAAPPAHGAKNEPAAAAQPNRPEPAPAISSVPNHAAPDLPAAAASNAPAPATRSDTDAPVRLSFTTPNAAEGPSFDALALKIAANSANGDNNFSIRLDPPELGRIEVNLHVRSDGHAQAELTADKPQTLELLQKDASSLERALKDAGLNLAGGLAFSLKGEGKSQAWRDMQNGSRGRALQIAAVDAANANADVAISAALAGHAYGIPTARLDIRV